jgi:hypothetical protein
MPQETAGLFDPPKSTDLRTNDPDELHKRLLALLKACCEREQACFACGATMYFVRMRKSGKLNPYTAEGVRKGEVFTPPDAFDLAIKRRGKVTRREADLRERIV